MCANFHFDKKKANYGTCQFVTCTGASWQTVRDRCDRVSCFRVIYFILFSVSLADKDDHKRWSMLGSVFWSCLGRAIVCTFFMRHGLTIIGYLSLSTSSFDQYKIRYYLRIVECSIHVQCLYECNDKRPASVQAGIRLNATAPSSVSGSVSHIGGDGWIIE